MKINRRTFTKSLTAGAAAAIYPALSARANTPAPPPATQAARATSRLSRATITRIRVAYPPNYEPNGPQAFPQSNMLIFVDTDAGITGVGQGGSPDLVRNLARSVIGKNAFDSEMIWQ